MNFEPPLPLPPTPIPEDILQLPEGFTWAGKTSRSYPFIANVKGSTVAVVWPSQLIWYGVWCKKREEILTQTYQEGMRLAYTLLMLGDE